MELPTGVLAYQVLANVEKQQLVRVTLTSVT